LGNVIDLNQRKATTFMLRGKPLAALTHFLQETGQFPDPPPLDNVSYPIYAMDTLKTLAGGGLLLEPDFCGKYPIHFALVTLGVVYQRNVGAITKKLIEAVGDNPDETKQNEFNQGMAAAQGSPLFICGQGLVSYTMNAMLMRFFMPNTYAGERMILVFNPLTEKVELWAGHPLDIGTPDASTTNEPSQSPGDAPAEAS